MLSPGTGRTILSAIFLLSAICLYCFTYIRSSGPNLGWMTVTGDDFESNYVLRPSDHIHREPKTILLTFNVTQGYRYPDGVRKKVHLINGAFPGPTIEARSGDELTILVHNWQDDDEGIAIHWHGLSMREANRMDGVAGLTQKAIPKFGHFEYRFRIDDSQAGTFWYHAHSGAQRADGLFGALIVHQPAVSGEFEQSIYAYDEEQVLLIGDWYHQSAAEVMSYYTDWVNFGNEPAPDSLLINGKGSFNCTMAVAARPVICNPSTSPYFSLRGLKTRLRVINVGALTGLTMTISGHTMTVFQLDGGNAVEIGDPANSVGILYPGERMDILVEQRRDGQGQPSVLSIELDPENMKFPNLALTPLQHFPVFSTVEETLSLSQAESQRTVDLSTIYGVVPSRVEMPQAPKQIFVLYTKIEILSEFRNIPKGFINRTSWEKLDENAPPLVEIDRNSEVWSRYYVPWVKFGTDHWFDIVVNNRDEKSHPFHLHGYDFYVLSSHKAPIGSYDAYNPYDTTQEPAGGPMNTRNPVRKDTVMVPRMGYVVLRVRADNEGLWFFHCHVLWHEAVGMAIAFQVGGNPPPLKDY